VSWRQREWQWQLEGLGERKAKAQGAESGPGSGQRHIEGHLQLVEKWRVFHSTLVVSARRCGNVKVESGGRVIEE